MKMIENWSALFPNFSPHELVNPFHDHCRAKTMEELPENIGLQLMETLGVVQKIRTYIGKRMLITSTYREKGVYSKWRKNTPHSDGVAIDCQIQGTNEDYRTVLDYLKRNMDLIPEHTRVIVEYSNGVMWFHVDVNYKYKGNYVTPGLFIMYPDSRYPTGMAYVAYVGMLPNEYV